MVQVFTARALVESVCNTYIYWFWLAQSPKLLLINRIGHGMQSACLFCFYGKFATWEDFCALHITKKVKKKLRA